VAALAFVLALAGGTQPPEVLAHDLGVEGQVFEPIEEDFRIALMRLIARQDWTRELSGMRQSADDYTKNLPTFYLPLAQKTQTHWKDVGIITDRDIFLPSVDWEHGSVFDTTPELAVPAGTYLNPVAKMPAAAIDRLFIFDATAPEQVALARQLMAANIPLLRFMIVAGDLGPLSKEEKRPIYHATQDFLDKFQVSAVPALVGFGKGPHQGHMATTEFKLPVTVDDVRRAWYGLAYPGYDPEHIADPVVTDEEARQTRAAFERAASLYKESHPPRHAP
jgi:conjugal transfer pilus assembly protein TraW